MQEGDVLQQAGLNSAPPAPPKKNHKEISAWAVALTIILSLTLILLGERIIFDLNKVANRYVDKQYTKAVNTGDYSQYGSKGSKGYAVSGLSYESSRLANQKVYYYNVSESKYRSDKLLIHACFILPLFLLTFLIYYLVNLRLKNQSVKVVMWGYVVFSIWMLLHLLGETTLFILDNAVGPVVYIPLIVIVIAFTFLGIFMQKKHVESGH